MTNHVDDFLEFKLVPILLTFASGWLIGIDSERRNEFDSRKIYLPEYLQ